MRVERCVRCGTLEPDGHGVWCWHEKQARRERFEARRERRARFGEPVGRSEGREGEVARHETGAMVRCPQGCWSDINDAQAAGEEPIRCPYCGWKGMVS